MHRFYEKFAYHVKDWRDHSCKGLFLKGLKRFDHLSGCRKELVEKKKLTVWREVIKLEDGVFDYCQGNSFKPCVTQLAL